jgi:hypothetical protein
LHADEELERLSHSNRKRIAVLPSSANISKKDTISRKRRTISRGKKSVCKTPMKEAYGRGLHQHMRRMEKAYERGRHRHTRRMNEAYERGLQQHMRRIKEAIYSIAY